MKVKDIMTENPEFISPESTVKDAAGRMKSIDVGFMPIGTPQKLAGVITDRDIVVRCVAEGKDPDSVYVKDIMTSNVKSVSEDSSIDEVSKIMRDNQIRRTLVVNGSNEIVGVLSLGDLVVDADTMLGGKTLKDVSKPSEPDR